MKGYAASLPSTEYPLQHSNSLIAIGASKIRIQLSMMMKWHIMTEHTTVLNGGIIFSSLMLTVMTWTGSSPTTIF